MFEKVTTSHQQAARGAPPGEEAPREVRVDIILERVVVCLVEKSIDHPALPCKVAHQSLKLLDMDLCRLSKGAAELLGGECHIWSVQSQVIGSGRQLSVRRSLDGIENLAGVLKPLDLLNGF